MALTKWYETTLEILKELFEEWSEKLIATISVSIIYMDRLYPQNAAEETTDEQILSYLKQSIYSGTTNNRQRKWPGKCFLIWIYKRFIKLLKNLCDGIKNWTETKSHNNIWISTKNKIFKVKGSHNSSN